MADQQSDIRPAHPSHSEFNKRLEPQSPARDVANEPWISRDKLPPLRREFDMNRDPYVRAQLLDIQKTESQRREESGRGSTMVGKDKPKLNLKPPQETGKQVNDQRFKYDWLKEQRDAAMAQAAPDQRQQQPDHMQTRIQQPTRTGPSR